MSASESAPTREEPDELISPIPHLRSVHGKAGYRDALATTKEAHLQRGFDSGYPVGAAVGAKVGLMLGILEGLIRATNSGDDRRRVEALRTTALRDLKIEKLLGSANVLGAEEAEATEAQLGSVEGSGHLVLLDRWTNILIEEAKKAGIDVEYLHST